MLVIGQEVQLQEGEPAMIVTGYASGMIECRWYDGHCVRQEAFREEELIAVGGEHQQAC
ncbi:YodC family protein [Pantoea sp. FN060301]|uniref:YodC family protein n=1 Tax=Pantoea sp. FN060301 TaxID=3420380 RepID=UPI003D16F195